MLPHGLHATDWLELPGPILHPEAPELVAARCGESAALLRALVAGEVYRSPMSADDHAFMMWPWYPEQDEELRSPAQRRANELGAGMPPLLDDPFESAFYLRFTGEHTFISFAEEVGVPPDELYLSRVPRVEPDDVFVEFEGGQRATHPWVQRFELVERAVDDLNWLTGDHRALGLDRVRQAISAYLGSLSGQDVPARRPMLQLTEVFEEPEPAGELVFERVFAVGDGALLQVSGWLVVVDGDDIRVLARVPGDVVFASRNVAIVDGAGLTAFDLTERDWRVDELDPNQEFGGPLLMSELLSNHEMGEGLTDMPLSPDARYGWDGSRVLRLQDGLYVTRYDTFGEIWETVDAPALIAFEDLSTAGQRQTVLDGVTFTHRTSAGFRVRDEGAFAFALHHDHWRGFINGRLMRNDQAVATIGVAAHDGSFGEDARTLYVLTDTDLLEIEWVDHPVVLRTTPLIRIAGAIENFID